MNTIPRLYKEKDNTKWCADKENNFIDEDGSKLGVFLPAIRLPSGKYVSGEYTAKPLSGVVIMRCNNTDQCYFTVKEVIESPVIDTLVHELTSDKVVNESIPPRSVAQGE